MTFWVLSQACKVLARTKTVVALTADGRTDPIAQAQKVELDLLITNERIGDSLEDEELGEENL